MSSRRHVQPSTCEKFTEYAYLCVTNGNTYVISLTLSYQPTAFQLKSLNRIYARYILIVVSLFYPPVYNGCINKKARIEKDIFSYFTQLKRYVLKINYGKGMHEENTNTCFWIKRIFWIV